MKTLTVFSPTYNRKHTLPRTYESLFRQTCRDFEWLVIDDGSSDGTREWIESLGPKTISSGQKFDWMGRIVEGEDENHFVIQAPNVRIEYIYKPNGGLYTGYNVAYQTIQTELCVCIDSDDFMPDDAVDIILQTWSSVLEVEKKRICGIVGLDYNVVDKNPIGGPLGENNKILWVDEISHKGDKKYVLRSELMRNVSPMIGFEGEKDFNPHYMLMQVQDKYPFLLLNSNLCWVEYQYGLDSMSQNIWKQYMRSPHSYAKYRLLEMRLNRVPIHRKIMVNIHYISSCIIIGDCKWLTNSPIKIITILSIPFGLILYIITLLKNKKK